MASRRTVRRGRDVLTGKRAAALALVITIASFHVATATTARHPEPLSQLNPAEFHPIVFPRAPGEDPAGTLRSEPLDAIRDFSTAERTFAPRPTPAQLNGARVQLKAQPLRLTGKRASGSATWYCKTGVSVCHSDYSGGLYAAAGPALRVGDWRGRRVQVCGGGSCVVVTLVDWCSCGGSHIIDLYSAAFQQLAPLSSGAIRVTVRW